MMQNIAFGRPVIAAVTLSISSLWGTAPVQASGDLLVAPTRIVFDSRRGTEVILNNVGAEESTYRISLELRRMEPNGKLVDIEPEQANEAESAALGIIRYAPRRVTLPPNQPQAIRLGLGDMANLADGEYRAHLLFRAIPKAAPVTADAEEPNGLKIQLIPIYGVTIPVIVRKGQLKATAAIANPHLVEDPNGPVLAVHLSREGNKSVYGEIRVTRQGEAEPAVVAKGIAVYPELQSRQVFLPLAPEQVAAIKGPVKIAYYETLDAGGGLIAETQTVIR